MSAQRFADLHLFPPQQRGVALVVSLMMLAIVLALGLGAVRLITAEERMTGYLFDRQLAFQAAEAALTEIETQVGNFSPIPGTQCAALPAGPGAVLHTCPAPVGTAKPRWIALDPNEWGMATPVGPVGTQISPQYLIEYMGSNFPCSSSNTALQICSQYRITVRVAGSSPRAEVMLQSLYLVD